MPLYMDRHELDGSTAENVALAHVQDLEVQDRYGVRYLSYWFDYERQAAFCLVDSPSKEAAEQVHREAHGLIANSVMEVDPRRVEEFLGGILHVRPGEPYVATAFRVILFTDLEGSTVMTQRLGDAAAMRVLRSHDAIVRNAVLSAGGQLVKHTGDGIMASFVSVSRAVESAVAIQQRVAEYNRIHQEAVMGIRIGLSAGEPVTEAGDLFGAAVQLAARLCATADPGTVVVSSAVRDLAAGKGFAFVDRGQMQLRGFDEPTHAYAVQWQ